MQPIVKKKNGWGEGVNMTEETGQQNGRSKPKRMCYGNKCKSSQLPN